MTITIKVCHTKVVHNLMNICALTPTHTLALHMFFLSCLHALA